MFDFIFNFPDLFNCIKKDHTDNNIDIAKVIKTKIDELNGSLTKIQKLKLILSDLMEFTNSNVGVINEYRDGVQYNLTNIGLDLNSNQEFHISIYPIYRRDILIGSIIFGNKKNVLPDQRIKDLTNLLTNYF